MLNQTIRMPVSRSVGTLLCAVLVLMATSVFRVAASQELLWFDGHRPTPQAYEALELLAGADQDGLRAEDYKAQALVGQVRNIAQSQGHVDVELVASTDRQLTRSMEKFLTDLTLGRVRPQDVHQDFDDAPVRQFDADAYLRQALLNNRLSEAVEQARPQFPLYPLLRQWLAVYRTMPRQAWATDLPAPKGNKLEAGQPYEGMTRLRERLSLLGDLPQSADSGQTQTDIYDAPTVQAVRAFQSRHGLKVDGIIGQQTLAALNVSPAERARQIELSMERVRWTPLQHGDRLLVVNIPGFTLYGYETDRKGKIDLQLEMRVVIGRALNHRTPLFDETMRYIEFSPYWNIPPSIARSETIPAIRRDPGYFARQQLEFVGSDGRVYTTVTPQRLDAVLRGELRIRQRPGPHNALGDIKFVFPNNQNIFMHHTPATQLFDQSRRDFSHGCIRVEKPVELAQFVLANDPRWDRQKIVQAMDAGKSSTTRLGKPIPVVIAYSTVMARDGKLYFYPDIYGHDQRLQKALAQR